jgi:hypothetical protein
MATSLSTVKTKDDSLSCPFKLPTEGGGGGGGGVWKIAETKEFNTSWFHFESEMSNFLVAVCKQSICLHFGIQNIELYSTTIYILMLLQYNKLSRYNNEVGKNINEFNKKPN